MVRKNPARPTRTEKVKAAERSREIADNVEKLLASKPPPKRPAPRRTTDIVADWENT